MALSKDLLHTTRAGTGLTSFTLHVLDDLQFGSKMLGSVAAGIRVDGNEGLQALHNSVATQRHVL